MKEKKLNQKVTVQIFLDNNISEEVAKRCNSIFYNYSNMFLNELGQAFAKDPDIKDGVRIYFKSSTIDDYWFKLVDQEKNKNNKIIDKDK